MTEVARNARTVSESLDQLIAGTSGTLDEGIPLNKLGNQDVTGRLFFQTKLATQALPDGLPEGKGDNLILAVVSELQKLARAKKWCWYLKISICASKRAHWDYLLKIISMTKF